MDEKQIFTVDVSVLNDKEVIDFCQLVGEMNKERSRSNKQQLRLVWSEAKPVADSPKKHSHYFKDVRHIDYIDVYMVCALFGVTDAAIAHAIKKQLVAGGRGAGKDFEKDIKEAIDSLTRCLAIQKERGVEIVHVNTKIYPHIIDESISFAVDKINPRLPKLVQESNSLNAAQEILVALLSSYHANHLKAPATNATKQAIVYLQMNRPDLAKSIGC
jgi:hypothetical protein